MSNANRALQISQSVHPIEDSESLRSAARSAAYLGQWEEVLRLGDLLLNDFSADFDAASTATMHQQSALAAMELGRLSLAAEHLMAAIAESRRAESKSSEMQSWLSLCRLAGLAGERETAAAALGHAKGLLPRKLSASADAPSTSDELDAGSGSDALKGWLSFLRAAPYRHFGDQALAVDYWLAALAIARAAGDPFHQALSELELRLVARLPLTRELRRWSQLSPRHRALAQKLEPVPGASGPELLPEVSYRARSLDWLGSFARASRKENFGADVIERLAKVRIETARSPFAYAVLASSGLVIDTQASQLVALGTDSPRFGILRALAEGTEARDRKSWTREELFEKVWGMEWHERHATLLEITLKALAKAVPGVFTLASDGSLTVKRPGMLLAI